MVNMLCLLAWFQDLKEFTAYGVSLLIGMSLGLIGAGGSILTIPAFVYILRIDPLLSSIYSMFVVGVCSMVGSIKAMLNQLVNFEAAMLFGLPSVTGVLLARKLIFPFIPSELVSFQGFVLLKETMFMLCLSVLMFIISLRMLNAAPIDERDGDENVKTKWLLVRGLFTGIVAGLLGIGGGFLIVPALYFWAKLPMKTAIGTALAIITINSLFGFSASVSTAVVDWYLLFKFSSGAILGILIGSRLSEIIAANYLKKIFGWFVLLVSVYMLCKEFFF